MKNLKKILAAVATAAMVFSLTLTNILAAEEYFYTVTFYSGNQGVFSDTNAIQVISKDGAQGMNDTRIAVGEDRITVSGLREGDVVNFNVQSEGAVSLKDNSKYYVQGLRLSGRDNDSELGATAFRVTEDEDYVVAYGIQGDMTSYVVNYLDEEGNELAPSRTYYGNVGDKPVVAYAYIEGYTPQALSLTKTLSENQAENVFNFEYNPVPTEVIPGETVTVTVVEPGTANVVTTQVPTAGTGVTGGVNAGAAAGDNEAADTGAVVDGGEETANVGEAVEEDTGTETIEEDETPLGQIDLDEGEDAEANPDKSEESQESTGSFPIAAVVAIVVVAVAIVASVGVWIWKRSKK